MFSLFGVLRVFAKISLVSLCDLPAVRPLGHKQASESTADSREHLRSLFYEEIQLNRKTSENFSALRAARSI